MIRSSRIRRARNESSVYEALLFFFFFLLLFLSLRWDGWVHGYGWLWLGWDNRVGQNAILDFLNAWLDEGMFFVGSYPLPRPGRKLGIGSQLLLSSNYSPEIIVF